MERTTIPYTTAPLIAPCAPSAHRPLWSVMIPVYNCASFLPGTLQSVLQQAPGNNDMQIEVVDDASTDADIAALVQQVGGGRITYYRQPENVGSLRNFETCLNRSRGRYIHLLHGDDKVRAGYYEHIAAILAGYPEAGAAFCRYAYINEKDTFLFNQPAEANGPGLLTNWLVRMGQRQRIQYCAMTVRREVYEKLGGFYGVYYGEDWEMWARIAAHYPVAYTPEILAEYRMHFQSVSGRSFTTGQNMKDLTQVMDIIGSYLPEGDRAAVRKIANKYYAYYAVELAHRVWKVTGSKEAALAQVRQAVAMHTDVPLYVKIATLYAKLLMNYR